MKTPQQDIEGLRAMLKTLLQKSERMEEQLAKIGFYLETRERSPWMTVEQAATYCGYHKNTFYGKYKNEIPHHQRDAKIMFHVDDVENWMKKNVKTPELWK